MNDIISVLKQRASINPDSLDNRLFLLAQHIIELSSEHQKRVIKIMPEFDLHDVSHLKKVEENITLLLGEALITELSSIELFLLLAASYLHDCGMAPADWELSLMKMTEGYDSYVSSKKLICNDGKKPYTFREAKEFIEKNKPDLYNNFDEIKNWDFAPDNENILIDYLSELLIEYQTFRNGHINLIKDAVEKGTFDLINYSIRIDFIRTTHHIRSAKYIKNLQKIGTDILGEVWIQRLFSDLADVCMAHGENLEFIRKLKRDVKYVGLDGTNLQFISMMLRIGDIVHYSYDRAPSIIRNAMSFQSEYSKNEWLHKIGLNYTIKDGAITFMASCQTPKDYYHLQDYLNWIDEEINNLDLLKRSWQQKYQINISEVERNNIEPDKSKFIPVKDKKFILSQNKIIELLMGIKLYKDPFSSIRELYQNSLDACRCRLAIAKMNGQLFKGEIEFGIEHGSEGHILYCKDNGIGMDEFIIENYLLKIGNSFYNSKEFYRKQAQWGISHSPVSQFGIGILSCFIIGFRIEIVTKSIETHKCIVCCIDGAKENFYYKVPTREDEEQIVESGTLVKVFLHPEYENKINNLPIQKLGLVLQYKPDGMLMNEFAKYNNIFKIWETSLYHYLNDYINNVPSEITLKVRFADNSTQRIYNKPFTLNIGDLGIEPDDQQFIDRVLHRGSFYEYNGSILELQRHLKLYSIHIETESIEYNSIIALPLPDMETINRESFLFQFLQVRGSSVSVDGISVEDRFSDRNNFFNRLVLNGNINYIGSTKPQLSVDRKDIISFPTNYSEKYREVVEKYIIEIIDIAHYHIRQYNLSNKIDTVDLIWKYIFNRQGSVQPIFVNNLAKSELGNIRWPLVKKLTQKDITIKEFLSLPEITLYQYDYAQLDNLSKMLVCALFLSATNIEVVNNTIKITRDSDNPIPENEDFWEYSRYLVPVADSEVFKEYDIISNLYPLVPYRLIDNLSYYNIIPNSKAVSVHACGNCYNDLFFQDSRLVNPGIGLYRADSHSRTYRDSYIQGFDSKKSNFQCMDFDASFPCGKTCTPYFAYISPTSLTSRDIVLLESIKESKPIYYEGVIKGWSLLVTNMDIDNIIIRPGKVDRKTMIEQISAEFWDKYSDWTFKFLDGTEMKKP